MSETSIDNQHSSARKRELQLFIFLTIFLAPMLSIFLVGGYGLVIWAFQLISETPIG